MSVGLLSDEVAKDYKESLDDLAGTARHEISNLTVIAKENTEHALAISRVLENHIMQTAPHRKLPALYLLDSIVKNVGTPYTLYFGRNLFNTFMNAYALVDPPTRRKMEEMLHTWRRPVFGSLDPRPVFAPDITGSIDNALIKAQTAFVQQHQQQQFRSQQEMARSRGMQTPINGYRNTPTPPQTNGQFRLPQGQAFPQPIIPQQSQPQQQLSNVALNGNYQNPTPHPQYLQHPPPQQAQTPYQQPFQQSLPQQYPPPGPNLGILHRDVDSLIRSHRADLAANIYDTSIQARLSALLELQGVLRTGQLPPDQVQQVRDQVDALMGGSASPAVATVPATMPAMIPATIPATIPYNVPSYPPQQTSSQPPPVPPPAPAAVDLSSLLSSNNLATIIAKAQRGSATPPVVQASLAQDRPSSEAAIAPPNPMAALAGGGSDLIASLRTAGILPTPDTRTPTNAVLPFIPPPATGKRGPGPVIDVQLTSASLKIPRPQLITYLYEAQPNQCTTCGRRFLATEEGRARKARHLDWHFRTNQRMADSANRGQSRSWYVDELEWIESRDDPEAPTDISLDPHSASSVNRKANATVDPKTKYIPVPSDQQLANLPCPICQEKFDTVWNDEAQDFVWMDAVKVGGRVYHASCHSEVRREEGARTPNGVGGRIGTPDSVLGKRKAEVGLEVR